MNFQTICRICIDVNSDMVSIFEPYNFSPRNAIFKVITDCASVQIHEHDGFPKQICRKCLGHLAQAYSFKKLCEESDDIFQNDLLANYKTAIKSELSDNEINTEITFVKVEKEEASCDVFESMEYEEPASLKQCELNVYPTNLKTLVVTQSLPRRPKGRCRDCGNKKDRKTTTSCKSCCKFICREHEMPTCGECFNRMEIKLVLPQATKQSICKRVKGRCKDCGSKKDRKTATSCKTCCKFICREHTNPVCCGCYEVHFNKNGV